MNERYLSSIRKHWSKWLPKRVAALKAAGEWEGALQVRANQTRARVDELMAQGYQLHEAEEVALTELVLLKPEPEANLEPWERAELMASERAYRARMK